jgi:Asp-tRNA(Asn)/Glu-tRNA(Gln) amidotransferase A subunit family amidase
MGKTNMPAGNQDVQADNPLFGPTNPWDTSRTSGGSAGGGAVATAADLTAFDFGASCGGHRSGRRAAPCGRTGRRSRTFRRYSLVRTARTVARPEAIGAT